MSGCSQPASRGVGGSGCIMPEASGFPCSPMPLRKTPISWQGGSWAAATHPGHDLDPRFSTLTTAST